MILRLLQVAALVFLAAAAGSLWVWRDANRPYLRSKAPAAVDIAPGTSSVRIARELEVAGVIRHRQTFLLLHYLNPKQTFKAGFYSFDHPFSPRQVFGEMVSGDVSRQELTIPEGLNRFDIASGLENAGIVKQEEFLKAAADPSLIADLDPAAPNLEGYLFPDTYQFPRHKGAVAIVRLMVNRFRQVYAGLVHSEVEFPVHTVVAIASMVELETKDPEERPLVASVFYNRLKRGIPLQCDPTVIYAAILEHTYSGVIRQADLKSNSPYNTYIHGGLPPGPISNPGKSSLLAALHPARSNYLYFVANSTGHHTFSRTLAEHNLNARLYRRSLAGSRQDAIDKPDSRQARKVGVRRSSSVNE